VSYSQGKTAIHVFLESDDDLQYYLLEIRKRTAGLEVFPYRCGGRPGVLEARGCIKHQDYPDAICLFLIDRDYNELFEGPVADSCNTYITDGHSIENNLVCELAIEVIAVDLAGLSKVDPKFQKLIVDFRDSHKRFIKKIEPILAWSLAYWAEGGKPNFNNVDLAKVIVIDARGAVVRIPGGFDVFRKSIHRNRETGAISGQEIRRWLRILRSLPEKRRVRGKYELWFFTTSLLIALDGIRKSAPKKTKYRVPTALREGKLFEVLGGRLPMPNSFLQFLDQALPSFA
jgi:hypothetical protein